MNYHPKGCPCHSCFADAMFNDGPNPMHAPEGDAPMSDMPDEITLPRHVMWAEIQRLRTEDEQKGNQMENSSATAARIRDLEHRLSALQQSHEQAARKAAIEICATYDVSTPRGKSYANRKEVTISIIIKQAIDAAITEAQKGESSNG